MTDKKLTTKQRLFIDEYLISFNATQAAIEAGYSKKTAHSIGWENLRKPEISKEIEKHLDASVMSKKEVLNRLAEQARNNISQFVGEDGRINWEAIREKGHLIKSITPNKCGFKLELYDVQRALELIGKHHSLFNDRIEHTGVAGNPIEIVVVEKPE